jgi:hypothetical protein
MWDPRTLLAAMLIRPMQKEMMASRHSGKRATACYCCREVVRDLRIKDMPGQALPSDWPVREKEGRRGGGGGPRSCRLETTVKRGKT